MKAVVLPVPGSWRQIDPPRSKYAIGDLELDVSAVQGLPEDPHEWIRVEVARRTGQQIEEPTRITSTTGWPVLLAEVAHGDRRFTIMMYQLLEFAAVATLSGPAAAFAAHADEVKLVLMQATVHWGDPPVTIAALMAGATKA